MAKTFGITAAYQTGITAYGVAQEVTRTSAAETATARDENGKITDEKAYSRKATYNIRAILNGTPPEAGDQLTISAETYLIKSVEVREQNTNYCELTITAEKDDDATQVAYSS